MISQKLDDKVQCEHSASSAYVYNIWSRTAPSTTQLSIWHATERSSIPNSYRTHWRQIHATTSGRHGHFGRTSNSRPITSAWRQRVASLWPRLSPADATGRHGEKRNGRIRARYAQLDTPSSIRYPPLERSSGAEDTLSSPA